MPGLIGDLDPEATARRLARCSPTSPASKQPPHRPPPSVKGQLKTDEVHDESWEKAGANRAVPSPCAAPPRRALAQPTPPSTSLLRGTGGAPLPPPKTHGPVAPRCDRRRLPHETLVVPSPCHAPTPTPTPTYCFAPAFFFVSRASSLFPRPYVPASVVLPSAVQTQQQTRTAAEAAMARTQRPIPYSHEGIQAAAGPNNKKREESAANLGQALIGSLMSKPTDEYVLESLPIFEASSQKETDIIQPVLMMLPEGPGSTLHREESSNGDDANIHTYSILATRDNGDESGTPFRILCFDVGPELVKFGSIRSEPWNRIWEQQPLILQDADIVRAAKAIEARVDFVERISNILDKHPGPVKYFRVDSCKLENGIEQLQKWLELLRRKQVKEVVFVNCRWPFDIFDFPINSIDCQSLERISLCFVKVSDICLHYVTNLNLSCCSISTQDLYGLSYQCQHLKELNIGVFEGDAIRVNSESLEILTIWRCTVRKVAVQHAVKLRRVSVGALPTKPALRVGIWIEGEQVLTDAFFDLSVQSVSICSLKTNVDNEPLLNLRRLALHFTFKVEKEKDVLMNLMKRSTTLRELILWRNDEPYRFECLDAKLDDWSARFNGLPGLKLHLQVFMIKDYKGGHIELAMSSAILEHASNLQQLILQADSFQNDSIFNGANTDLMKVARASTTVVIKCEIGISVD